MADSYISFRGRGAENNDYFPFEAAGPAEDDDIIFDEKKRELHIRGYELDTIVEIGPVWSVEGGPIFRFVDEYLRGLQHQRTFYEWERLCKARSGSKYRGTDEDMLSVYWHTLVAGGTYDGREVDLNTLYEFRLLFMAVSVDLLSPSSIRDRSLPRCCHFDGCCHGNKKSCRQRPD